MEPTLAGTYSELRSAVAVYAGYDPDSTRWNANQAAAIEECVKAGVRQFYYPTAVPNVSSPPDWSFLRPEAVLQFPEGSTEIRLPDDFGAFCGPLTIRNTSTASVRPFLIQWVNEGRLRGMYSSTPSMTGPPLAACEVPLKGTGALQGQRKQLLVFPTSDQDYELQCVYYVNPDCLTGAFPYAYGGPQHYETLKASCLSYYEEIYDNITNGPLKMKFIERLVASVSLDNRNKPQRLGYNGNREPWDDGRINHWWNGSVTYNGASTD